MGPAEFVLSSLVVKLEGNPAVRLGDIQSAAYVDNGVFHWHQVRVRERTTGRTESFGISNNAAAIYFATVLHALRRV